MTDNILVKIEHHIWSNFESENDIGLMSGLTGTALFYHYAQNSLNN